MLSSFEFSFALIVRRQVVFGLLLCLFPCGVHLRVFLIMLETGITWKCSSHLMRLCRISLRIHISRRRSFEIRFGQKILQVPLWQMWWKIESDIISLFVTLHHVILHTRTDLIWMFYCFMFVFRLYCLVLQMGRSIWNEDLALARILLISFLCCMFCTNHSFQISKCIYLFDVSTLRFNSLGVIPPLMFPCYALFNWTI